MREPHIYGAETLADVSADLDKTAAELGVSVRHFQSNHEGAIVDAIQAARGNTDWIIINAGAFTHTSVAIRDALAGLVSEITVRGWHVAHCALGRRLSA